MKRITFILVAWAVVMTLSQCKKEEPVLPNNTDDSVAITLNVKGNSRAIVNTDSGSVSFENQDKIYVACAGKYVGTLTYSVANQNFSGTISNATSGELLHFYFLGNVIPGEQLVAGSTSQCSIDISDQSQNYTNGNWHLPVISYGVSNEPYGSQSSYSSILENKCALVKFNVHQEVESDDDIYISGVNHIVTISFGGDSFSYDKNNEGYINLGKGLYDNVVEKWVILLPQEAIAGSEGGAYINNEYYGYCSSIPAISANSFHTSGIDVYISNANGVTSPIGAIKGLFSIGSSRQVWFSQGNLQNAGNENNPIWKFADNQWDITAMNNYDYFDWITATQNYNNISNGASGDVWRNLSYAGWSYIINYRQTYTGIRYAKAIVNNVNGLILLPDDWKSGFYDLHNTNNSSAPFNSNVIDVEHWSVMEDNGAVFLPASGNTGIYWTSSHYNYNLAYSFDFNNNSFMYSGHSISSCYSVRLVQDY